MRKFSPKLHYILVLLVVFFAHSTYIPNGFTWLDHGDIQQKRAVVALTDLPTIFVQPFGVTGFYRPFVTLVNSTDFALYQSFAPGYHVTNSILHIAVVAIAPLFLSVFFAFSFFEILIIMLIVGLHPIGWLPVGGIAYRPELLVTFFIMLTIYLHAKARQQNSPLFASLTVLSFFCALMSKETALFLIPALLIFWELTQKKRSKQPLLLLYIPEFVVVCLYIFLHVTSVPELWIVQYFQATFSEAIGTRIVVTEKLFVYFISPLKPPLSDAVTLTGIISLPVLLALAAIGLLIVFFNKLKEKKAVILFGILLLPALSIIPVPRLGSPHYAYIPLVGFAVLVVLLLRYMHTQKRPIRSIAYGTVFVWMIIAIVTTITGGSRFKNDETLFAPEVAADPTFLEGYFYLGNYYVIQKDFQKAEFMYTHALKIQPEIVAYHESESIVINLAIMKLQQGKSQAAIKLFQSIMPLEDTVQNEKLKLFIKSLQSGA